jgi:uncharacterized protein
MANEDKFFDQALKEANKDNPDMAEVKKLLEKSVMLGNTHASYILAGWYLQGKEGVLEQDMKKAVELLTIAVSDNIPSALFDLAICYEEGLGVKKDERTAFELYLKAALEGDKDSIYSIGRCYYHGIGVIPDKQLALIWLEKAQDLGVTE